MGHFSMKILAPEGQFSVALNNKGLNGSDLPKLDENSVAARFSALKPIMEYAQTLINLRRSEPTDDLVGGLVAAEVEGQQLDDGDIMQIMILLLLAGFETTQKSMMGAALVLSRHPEEQARLRADPSLIPRAIEECLRIEPPLQALGRKTTRDVELAGVSLPTGSQILTAYAAANFDPAAFECPARFDMDRKANRHFTFGRGVHTCVGAPIARMEIRVFLETLLSLTAHFEVKEDFVDRALWPDSGLNQLVLRVVPRS